jgi:glycosyltransferase involved in cell wall biosynthesis/GT2 family glycosyltransferase
VADPSAESRAEAMRSLWNDRPRAARMGAAGRRRIAQINWPAVVATLLEAAAAPAASTPARLRATVLDMQPIDPPVGGGRLRLLGLYHDLHGFFRTDYIGSYDWPGEKYRTVAHSDTLLETTIPLSQEHFEAAAALSREANNKTVIDLSFSRLGALSTDYVRAAIDHVIRSDVVVFSHPWALPLVARYLRPDQLVVYESHNVEGYLRAQFLDREVRRELDVLEEVVRTEYQALRAADLVLACSPEDIELFVSIYEIDPAKFRLVPNGVMTSAIRPAERLRKAALKNTCSLDPDGIAAIFLGSNYGPNVEAAHYILETLASELPELQFVIAGGVGAAMPRALPDNVKVTGLLSEEEKLRWLGAADIAVNPMSGGSGTNIKMFDFMAAGLATLSTPTGARGIAQLHPLPYLVAEREAFPAALRRLAGNRESLDTVAAEGRRFVEQHFSWERISKRAGRMMRAAYRKKGCEPYFSVIVPSYNRPAQLSDLLNALRKQTFTAFEVIVVDQSPEPLAVAAFGLDIEYCHTDVRGAIHARNYGASLATAARLAFIDDDCLPDSRWLENARRHFESADGELVGIEGEIVCPESDRTRFRVVTNVGGAGLYMTANLCVTASAFRLAGGFDPIFDNPHFREDTDLGWRLEELGAVLRAADVVVTHPAAPKTESADSDAVRDRFFEKDALLCRKHPDKFRQLFLFEEHYRRTPGYWPNFLRGAQKYQVDLQQCFYSRLPAEVLQQATAGARRAGHS